MTMDGFSDTEIATLLFAATGLTLFGLFLLWEKWG
jgi:hypothetical protein